MKFLFTISDTLDKLSKFLMTVFLGAMTVVLFSQVVSRYIFNAGLAWSEELSRFLMIWMVFMGASVVAKERTQISVTALEEFIPHIKKILTIFQKIIVIIFMVLIIRIAMETLGIAKMQTSPNMGIAMHLVYFVIPLSAIFMIIHLVIEIYLDFKGGKQ